ncbi:MAG: hypothetical protein K940chlam9_00135 [Chlamydiae bacterium]|nr:hypothetical protein [Chlamydiota bacterium]
MGLVYLYTACLVLGMGLSQIVTLGESREWLTFLVDAALSYIMMEVGLELYLNKQNWKGYLKDYFVAAFTAALPWLFCFFYFLYFFRETTWQENLLVARFAAPTSSGILFSMLAAAGLAMTWLFRKVQILAIFDDIDTIILLIPLQFLLGGSKYILLSLLFFIAALLILAWRYLHQLRLPSGRIWLLLYSLLLAGGIRWFNGAFAVEMEILLPAFVFGALLHNPHDPRLIKEHVHEHAYIEAEERPLRNLDRTIKVVFMILVGLLMPKLPYEGFNWGTTTLHVLAITLISNIGKCFPMFCYKNEASLRQRAGVSISMFPRGEVGAGILLLAMEHGVTGSVLTVAGLSLALNLLLTGVFIWIVIHLTKVEIPP